MLCQNCKKNEASVRYTQIVNGEKIENIYPIGSLVSNNLICNNENIYIPEDKIYVSNEILINFVRSKEV